MPTIDIDIAYNEIQKLVQKFKALSAMQRKAMNEDATRQGYILPLFHALGWDTSDVNEVSPEEKVSRGFVDFAFQLSGVPRFFLETKRASEDLNDPRWVKQAIDYAWTKNVTWALLSDFEGLRVFNAEWQETNPFKAEFVSFDLDTYLTDFDRLCWLSREQAAACRLDSEAEKVGKKSRRLPVGQHLFDDLKNWRIDLFKDLKGFNPLWSAAQVDEAVLRVLNRLIFIRTAEDRQVEPPLLRALIRELKDKKQFGNLWAELSKLFREMDNTYDSELFAPHLADQLYVTSMVLEEVITGLYEKNYVSYNFNAIESDVLGTVYEQYLSSMVTEGKEETNAEKSKQDNFLHQPAMTVEERRMKRKSQGIYYTPAFVTKYIVRKTVGRYLQENSYDPSKPPRVLDMACGSGSFLIEAFDTLDSFVARQRGQSFGATEGIQDYQRRIELLHNCIFGVDKDKQAVDVARLNLMLRALHWREKLPMLNNIYNADSLQSDTWGYFKDVMQAGGFDIIIGNPPYVRQETLGQAFKEFAKQNFETYAGTADLYIYFIEQAHKLLKPGGWFGMIVSNKWMRTSYGKDLRKYLLKHSAILEIIDFGELPVFQKAATFPAILITRKQPTDNQQFIFAPIKRLDFASLPEEINAVGTTLDGRALQGDNWALSDDRVQPILEKMRRVGISLGDYVNDKVYYGIKTGYNRAFIITRALKDHMIAVEPKSAELIKPLIVGDDVRKYHINYQDKYLILIPKGWTNQQKKQDQEAWEWLLQSYPILAKHLIQFQSSAQERQDMGDYWWELRACAYYDEFEMPKIVYPEIAMDSRFSFDEDKYYCNKTIFMIPRKDYYLLGILNSKLAWLFLKKTCSVLGDAEKGGRLLMQYIYLKQLPIYKINFDNLNERTIYDDLVEKVERMLTIQKQCVQAETGLDDARHSLTVKIKRLDEEIDALIYQLYGLTDEEIGVVEGKA